MSAEHGHHGGENIHEMTYSNSFESLIVMIFLAALLIPAGRDVMQDTTTTVVMGEMGHGHH